MTLAGAAVVLACRSPRNDNGETIDETEAQPREAVHRTSAESARNSRFRDMRKKHADLSESVD